MDDHASTECRPISWIYLLLYMCSLSRNSKLYTSRDGLTGDIVLQFYRVLHLKYMIINYSINLYKYIQIYSLLYNNIFTKRMYVCARTTFKAWRKKRNLVRRKYILQEVRSCLGLSVTRFRPSESSTAESDSRTAKLSSCLSL